MPQTYTFASWNVNGLRAVLKKDPSFIQIAQELDVDILALQETKLQEGQVDIDLAGYHQTWSYAERKGYSGTAVFSRQEPLRVPSHYNKNKHSLRGFLSASGAMLILYQSIKAFLKIFRFLWKNQ